MEIKKELLRRIPKIDEILAQPQAAQAMAQGKKAAVTQAARQAAEQLRSRILAGETPEISVEAAAALALEIAEENSRMNLRPVVNGTGVVLHTNLGRARMSHEAALAAMEAAESYNTLEYDCRQGRRGSRYAHVESLLCQLTGAEAALAVNNNAAAVMLILGTLAKNRQVVVSRGELVEIGGSFRVPEIMEQSNSALVEVGTTNKTHPQDYERAITDQTAALLKVHTSNYKIMGFTEDVPLEQLAEIGRRRGLPVIYDLGSGALTDLAAYGIESEPTVQQAAEAGADIVSFSGDKLLGGPQAGIIVGKKAYIDAMKKNPLTRATRIDKLTLAALEATLRIYLEPEQINEKIPTYQMLSMPLEEMEAKGRRLMAKLADIPGLHCQLAEDEGQVGGGSVPTQMIPSRVVAMRHKSVAPDQLETRLRLEPLPIVGRISKDRYLLDMRTTQEEYFDTIAQSVAKATAQRGREERE